MEETSSQTVLYLILHLLIMKLVWKKVLWYLRWNEAYFSTLLLYIKLKYSLLQVQRTKINIKNIFITKYITKFLLSKKLFLLILLNIKHDLSLNEDKFMIIIMIHNITMFWVLKSHQLSKGKEKLVFFTFF